MRWVGALVFLLSLGCGDDGNGSGSDAGSDIDASALPDAPPTGGNTVTVNVVASGIPIADLPVAYANPDGSLVGTVSR